MNEFQYTIKKEVNLAGVGIHTGQKATVVFKPAGPNEGIKFIRVDLPGKPEVMANIDFVTGVKRGTTLENGNAKVQTVEHLLATTCGLGIDNIIVEVDAEELPVGDGSAKLYTETLMKAGLKKQEAYKSYYKPEKIIHYKKDKTELIIVPSDEFTVSSTINYNDEVLGSQFFKISITPENYKKEISNARTYCFESEIKKIKDWGLGKGGTFANTIVIGEEGITNTELRYRDEFVRHKILDLLGDLSLVGMNIKADVIAIRSGHAANIELAKKLKNQYLDVINKKPKPVMDINKLLQILPHRYPFLLVDRIEMEESNKVATGYKNVTVNEPFFKGHFPDDPIYPSSLVIEFMAQSSAVIMLSRPGIQNKLAYFMTIESAEFFDEVRPMDTLMSKVELVKARARAGKVKGVAYVKDRKIAEAEFMFSLVDK